MMGQGQHSDDMTWQGNHSDVVIWNIYFVIHIFVYIQQKLVSERVPKNIIITKLEREEEMKRSRRERGKQLEWRTKKKEWEGQEESRWKEGQRMKKIKKRAKEEEEG